MAEDKNMETMQEEIKLLKGEVKQSLASVRDYLLNMELPSSEFSTILAALGGDGQQKVTIDGAIANAIGNKAAEALSEGSQDSIPAEEITEESDEDEGEAIPEDEDLLDMENPVQEEPGTVSDESPVSEEEYSPEDSLLSPDETELSPDETELSSDETELTPEDALEEETYGDDGEFIEPEEEIVEQGETAIPEPEMPEPEMSEEEEQPVDYDRTTTAEVSSAIPKVNMLANLINWISRAKQEIGCDQLSTFLEVYGISGHLTPELKEIILHLAEITAERPEVINNAEVWSQSMLSLHGILTGGDAPLNPVIPVWSEAPGEAELTEEEIIEVDKPKDTTPKLKLVFPNGDGKSKEFCIDLNLEENGDDSPQKHKN